MLTDFSFLDYLWRGLVVGTLTSAMVFIVMVVISFLLMKRSSHQQMKWFFNNQLLFVLTVFTSSFAYVAFVDPELATGCFNQFVQGGSTFTITRIVAGLWLSVMTTLLVRDALRIWTAVRKSKNFIPLQDLQIQNQFDQLVGNVGLRFVELATTEENVSPFAWGLFRYKVVIPKIAMDSLSLQAMQGILAHELIHVRDHDALWRSFELLCRRLMFFNPIVYFVSARHLVTIEKAADEEAVKCGQVDAQELLKSLVEVVAICRQSPANPMVMNASRGFKEIKERMESLAQIERSVSSNRSFHISMLIAFLLSLGVSVTQAKMAVADLSEKNPEAGLMCSQVKHEKIIESWLNIQPAPNKCEE